MKRTSYLLIALSLFFLIIPFSSAQQVNNDDLSFIDALRYDFEHGKISPFSIVLSAKGFVDVETWLFGGNTILASQTITCNKDACIINLYKMINDKPIYYNCMSYGQIKDTFTCYYPSSSSVMTIPKGFVYDVYGNNYVGLDCLCSMFKDGNCVIVNGINVRERTRSCPNDCDIESSWRYDNNCVPKPIPTPPIPTPPTPTPINTCGNGKIDAGETCKTCFVDYPVEKCFPETPPVPWYSNVWVWVGILLILLALTGFSLKRWS